MRHTIGPWTATCLCDTPYHVDAGTMFGPVPREVWEAELTPDARHRMPLALNGMLLQNGERTILVDAGMGDRFSDADAAQWSLERGHSVLKNLRALGVAPDAVDTVIFSHLHADHAGGAVVLHKGRLTPAFPRALHIIQTDEWEALDQLNSVTRDWYEVEALRVLQSEGRVELVRGEAEVAPGVMVMLTGGHSPGHQVVMVRADADVLLFPADIVPTRHHGHAGWVSSYETLPGVVSDVKEALLAAASADGWNLFLYHEVGNPFCRAHADGDGSYHFEPIENKV